MSGMTRPNRYPFIATSLLVFAIAGCSPKSDVTAVPTASPEQERQQAATKQRLAELKKQYPNVPESALASLMNRPNANIASGPPH